MEHYAEPLFCLSVKQFGAAKRRRKVGMGKSLNE
jgi:hypothetical protein